MSEESLFEQETPNIAVTQLPDCRIQLDITVTPQDTNQAYDQAIKSVSKGVSLPGFRKGKAPKKVLEKNYPNEIDKEWRRQLIYTQVNNAVQKLEQKPIQGQVDKVDLKKVDKESGSQIVVEYESEPKSPVLDFSSFSFEPIEKEPITEEDREKTLERLRMYRATWEKVEDRPVELGDFIKLEIVANDDSKLLLCSNTQFHIEEGEVANWIKEAVLGKKVGEEATATSVKEREEVGPVPFKEIEYTLKIQEISKPKLPELDDSLAQKLGAETVELLKERVKLNLENERDNFIKLKKHEQIETFLIENYPLDLPKTLVDYEQKVLLRNRLESLLTKGVSEAWIKAHLKEIESEVEKYARKRLHMMYLLRQEASLRNIQVMVNELQREMILEQAVRAPEERVIHPKMKDEEKESRMYLTLLMEKTVDAIVKALEPNEKEVPPLSETTASETSATKDEA